MKYVKKTLQSVCSPRAVYRLQGLSLPGSIIFYMFEFIKHYYILPVYDKLCAVIYFPKYKELVSTYWASKIFIFYRLLHIPSLFRFALIVNSWIHKSRFLWLWQLFSLGRCGCESWVISNFQTSAVIKLCLY